MAGPAHRYEAVYRGFDSPLMSRIRREAYWRGPAIQAHRAELEKTSSTAAFEKQRDYLETAIELSGRAALSRVMYLAEMPGRR